MSVPLITKIGSFEAVVDHIIDQIVTKNPTLDVEDFKDWMMLQKTYSSSNYKKGLFFDVRTYYYCYKVYKKMRSGENQHHMILVGGKIGKGKSVLGSQLAALIDPSFNMTRVCYVPPHLFRRFAKSNPGEANQIDEGGNFFKAKNNMTKIGKDISQAFQLVRDLQQVLIVCYDEPEKFDKDIIDKFDGFFVKIFNPSEKGNHRYRDFYAFNNKDCDKVKILLKKKIPMNSDEVLNLKTWRGRNSKEMPVVNDFNEPTYRGEKRKYLREHMDLLANKWAAEYEQIDKVEEKPKQARQGYKVSEYAKLKGKHMKTIYQWIKKDLIPYEKVGNSIIVYESPQML